MSEKPEWLRHLETGMEYCHHVPGSLVELHYEMADEMRKAINALRAENARLREKYEASEREVEACWSVLAAQLGHEKAPAYVMAALKKLDESAE